MLTFGRKTYALKTVSVVRMDDEIWVLSGFFMCLTRWGRSLLQKSLSFKPKSHFLKRRYIKEPIVKKETGSDTEDSDALTVEEEGGPPPDNDYPVWICYCSFSRG